MRKKLRNILFYSVGLFFSFFVATYVSSKFLSTNVHVSSKENILSVNNAKAETNDSYYKVFEMPTGTIMSIMRNTAPEGYVICDGTEYDISDYTNLAEYIKEEFGSYNYFGGDGTTTFKVPDLRGEFLKGAEKDSNAGVHQSQGLPNIMGTFYNINHITVVSASGAFSVSSSYEYSGTNGGSNFGNRGPATHTFNASNSNSIYGNSTDVRPSNTAVLYVIKY